MADYKCAFEILINKYNISIGEKYDKYTISDDLSNMYISKKEYECIRECLEESKETMRAFQIKATNEKDIAYRNKLKAEKQLNKFTKKILDKLAIFDHVIIKLYPQKSKFTLAQTKPILEEISKTIPIKWVVDENKEEWGFRTDPIKYTEILIDKEQESGQKD